MDEPKFQRKIEDFVCANCGEKVVGNGYTDHCPKCLWSKHVDINPGDRKCKCNGLMEPVGIEYKNGKYRINYKCTKCCYTHTVDSNVNDNFETILSISNNI